MKKFLIVIGFLLVFFCVFIIYDTYFFENIPVLEIENDKVIINDLYIYGTHLNMSGNCNFIDEAELVLYDGDFISYKLNDLNINFDNMNDLIDSSSSGNVNRNFNLSNYINDGIYLDEIPIGDYYLFLRVKDKSIVDDNLDNNIDYKYYALENNTDYKETTYYSMSNFNKKIVITNENSYPTMMLRVYNDKKKNEVYDIVLDPGHGGMDGGASKNGYKETDFTMDLAIKLKQKLEKYGFKIKLTHDEGQLDNNTKLNEYGVHGRAVIPREVNAKYLFSLHLNSSNYESVSGLEIYTAKNINYDFSKILVNNITSLTGLNYSNNKINKIYDGIYSRNFTQENINSSRKDYEDKDLNPYEITTNSNYYYMIRETGGIVTGAYVDDRNSKIIGNPYVNSNVGTESYLLELGYLSNKDDLNNMIKNMDKYVEAIAISIKSLYVYNN